MQTICVYMCIPVVVPEFDVSPGLQDLPVFQPGELGLRLALGLAGEYGSGADGPGDGLRRLDELCRSWKLKQRGHIRRILRPRIRTKSVT